MNFRLPVFALAFGLCIAAGWALADAAKVMQSNRAFTPDTVTIAPGGSVLVTNEDNVVHHLYVDQPDMQYDSGEQPMGRTVEITFPKAGDFDVLCAIHPRMRLKVTVK